MAISVNNDGTLKQLSGPKYPITNVEFGYWKEGVTSITVPAWTRQMSWVKLGRVRASNISGAAYSDSSSRFWMLDTDYCVGPESDSVGHCSFYSTYYTPSPEQRTYSNSNYNKVKGMIFFFLISNPNM